MNKKNVELEGVALIAAIHLPPLPGSPGWQRRGCPSVELLSEQAVAAARAFRAAGFSALIIENFGDAPFYPEAVPPETVAAMALIGAAVRDAVSLPLGLNVLRNDARAALALAVSLGARFIRINVLSGVAATDQGLIAGRAHELLRERERLGAGPGSPRPVALLADVHVKHARPLAEQDLATAAADLVERAGADAVIVSGSRTGVAPAPEDLEAVRPALGGSVPLLVGSGLEPDNAARLAALVDGAIVASAALVDGRAGEAVDPGRARALVEAFCGAR